MVEGTAGASQAQNVTWEPSGGVGVCVEMGAKTGTKSLRASFQLVFTKDLLYTKHWAKQGDATVSQRGPGPALLELTI